MNLTEEQIQAILIANDQYGYTAAAREIIQVDRQVGSYREKVVKLNSEIEQLIKNCNHYYIDGVCVCCKTHDSRYCVPSSNAYVDPSTVS